MRNRLLRAIGIPLSLCLVPVAGSVRGQEAVDPVAHRLSSVEIFAIGPIGYAGITSEGEKDYRAILREPGGQALKSFNLLYETGNLQAKAYALLGIKRLGAARFKVLYGALTDEKSLVKIERGCIVSYRTLRELASDIDELKFPYDK